MRKLLVLLFTLALAFVLVSCGGGTTPGTGQDNSGSSGGDAGGTNPPATLDVTGNWEMSLTSSSANRTIGGYLTLNGTSITGTVQYLTNAQGVYIGAKPATVTGTLNNQAISLTLTGSGETLTITATLSDKGHFTGTFAVAASSETGSATGFQIPALTGNWAGTLKGSDNSTTTLTATLTQSAPTADSKTGLAEIKSNNVNLSGTCFNGTATIPGEASLSVIGGTMVILGINVAPEGQQMIQIFGHTNPTGTTIDGDFVVRNLTCREGTVTLTKQ